MTITALPSVPSRSDTPANFVIKADAFMAALPQFGAELNAMGTALNLATTSTSTSSVLIGTGAKTFTVAAGLGYVPGMALSMAYTTTPTNNMFGTVQSYSGTTLIVNVTTVNGSGTYAVWNISLAAASSGAGFGANSFTGNQTLAPNAAFRTSVSTLASSATPDIWTNQSNKINYTGTVTATGFAAAPQAGMSVTLICAAAAQFTAGVNMLIDGCASGQTYTAVANEVIEVIALATTQFKLNPRRSNSISQLDSSDVITDTGANGQRTLTIDGVVRETQTAVARQSTIDGGSTLYPEFKCRSWGRFTGATGALLAGGNCSVSRTSAGLYVVTFATAMPDANYSVVINGFDATGDVGSTGTIAAVLYTAAGFTLDCETGNGTPVQTDPTNICFAVFR